MNGWGFSLLWRAKWNIWSKAARETNCLQEHIYFLSHSTEDYILIWKETSLCYQEDNTSTFWTDQETHFVVSHSKKCLMGFGALTLLCWWDISTAPSASVQAHQFAPARSSFPQTVLLFLPWLAAQLNCITSNRAGLSFGDFFAWATEGSFGDRTLKVYFS